MKCIVISGGSGNKALVSGLLELYPKLDLNIVVNAFDDGKSTGICRLVTNSLGVSDIRKNHYRLYSISNKGKEDDGIYAFYNNRYNLPKGKECAFVEMALESFHLGYLSEYAIRFFSSQDTIRRFSFNDFNIANIIYAQMYSELGYKESNAFFSNLLGIKDIVLLNTFDNVVLQATTDSGNLNSEAEIVSLCDDRRKICGVNYVCSGAPTLNSDVVELIKSADLIVLSPGTFWSSIYPTIHYGSLYKHLNESNAHKVWVMNNNEDGDSFGVGSNELIRHLSETGLDTSKFIILENKSASPRLRESTEHENVIRLDLGLDEHGLHEKRMLAYAIYNSFFGLDKFPCKSIYVDFDGTLWDKDYKESFDRLNTSIENVSLASKIKNLTIVSGNNYSQIKDKLCVALNGGDGCFANKVWADANAIEYTRGKITNVIEDFVIKDTSIIEDACYRISMEATPNSDYIPTCYKIKPIYESRVPICEEINKAIVNNGLLAKPTGRTSIDIVSSLNDKSRIVRAYEDAPEYALFVGDEISEGNDSSIANLCGKYIEVKSVFETNIILKCLCEQLGSY